jgi:hypothetical protein
MSDWIEINLPWHIHLPWEDRPRQPDLSEKEKEFFGTTLDEWKENIKLTELNKQRNELQAQFEQSLYERQIDRYSDEWETLMDGFALEMRDKFPGIVAYHEECDKRDAWDKQQPEFQAWEEALEEFRRKESELSFYGRGLNVPGTLIEMADGAIYLIGSINTARGCCDDCAAFEREDIVKRYKLVYDFAAHHLVQPPVSNETSAGV